MAVNPAMPDLIERLDRVLQLGRAGISDVGAVTEFQLCLSLFDGPETTGAVAELRRRSGARTFAELLAFMRTSGLSEADLNAIADDVERRVLSFDKANLTKVLRAAWPREAIREPRSETQNDHRAETGQGMLRWTPRPSQSRRRSRQRQTRRSSRGTSTRMADPTRS